MKQLCIQMLVFFAAFIATGVQAYTVQMHQELTRRSLPESAFLLSGAPLVQPANPGQRVAFRTWLYNQAINHSNRSIAERFRKRYPTSASFSNIAMREFLSLNMDPQWRVYGIDRAHTKAMSPRDLLVISSADPDLDQRNQSRFAYNRETKAFELDINGDRVPHDPSTLNMGNTEGLSSQAHAHYGLPNYDFSDDPAVLKESPERFLMKTGFSEGPVLAMAAEMTQMHTDLSLLAWLWDKPGSRYLALSFAGQSFHYLQDVGNQIHTVQVGAYDFFVSAKLQYWWRALITAGGYLGELRPFTAIGIDILTNHHSLIEELTALRFLEAVEGKPTKPVIETAVQGLGKDLPGYKQALDAVFSDPKDHTLFGRMLTEHLIETSAPEGSTVYQQIEQLGCGRLSVEGFKIPKDGVEWPIPADDLICHADDEPGRALEHEMYALQAKAFGRVSTSLRRYDEQMAELLEKSDKSALVEQILARFLVERLDMLDAAESRRAKYVAAIQPKTGGPSAPYRDDAWLYGEIIFVVMMFGLGWFRSRRRAA